MSEGTRANGDEGDQPKVEDVSERDRTPPAARGTEDLMSRLSPEPLMSMRLCTEPGSSADAVRHYVQCVCKSCSRSFRFHIPIPHGQQAPRCCPNCGTSFSERDARYLLVFALSLTAKLFDGESDRPLYFTGTCANCKSRFRLDAREVCNVEEVHCPHCGFDFGEDGRVKLIEHARRLLGKSKK